jgi:pimeloyl-ACP methyl ester carboxylesterase
VTIIAHSLGCLVSRYYVECLDGANRTRKLILMGGPHSGSPRALMSIVLGPHILPFGLMDAQLRSVTASFPGMYQGLPAYPCVTDQHGKSVDLLHDETWLPEAQRPHLKMAREFRRELGTKCSVPAVSVFGYGIKTITSVTAERATSGLFKKLELNFESAGDDSMPETTGMLAGTEIHPVRQHHAALHIDSDVKMRLKLELMR